MATPPWWLAEGGVMVDDFDQMLKELYGIDCDT